MTEEPPRIGKRVKKSDTLQVRIPHETKQAFTDACREDDVAISDRIRGWIENFLATRQRPSEAPSKGIIAMIPKPIRKRRYLLAGAAAIGATALLALPSAANTTFRAMFDQLDTNHDDKVTEQEFMAMTKKMPFFAGPMKLAPERRADLISDLRSQLGKPRRAEYLPPLHPELEDALRKGERTWESLSDQELLGILPIWDDKNFPVDLHNAQGEKISREDLVKNLPLATPEQQLEMEKRFREEIDKLGADPKPRPGGAKIRETCGGHSGISDAEFANPWMNSNATDMLKMFKDGDRNKDGVVMFEEFQTSQTETARIWFGSMDMDSDNKLTMQDFMESQEKWKKFQAENPDLPTCTPANPKPRWLSLDTNKDGAVSFEEYLVPAQLLDPR